MGRGSEEFWSLSYREIHACVDQYLDECDERLMLFGTGIATDLNIAAQGQTSHTWSDIFRSGKKAAEEAPAVSASEISMRFRIAHALWHRAMNS